MWHGRGTARGRRISKSNVSGKTFAAECVSRSWRECSRTDVENRGEREAQTLWPRHPGDRGTGPRPPEITQAKLGSNARSNRANPLTASHGCLSRMATRRSRNSIQIVLRRVAARCGSRAGLQHVCQRQSGTVRNAGLGAGARAGEAKKNPRQLPAGGWSNRRETVWIRSCAERGAAGQPTADPSAHTPQPAWRQRRQPGP